MALSTASTQTRLISSPKQASRIILVPNREILQRRVAELFAAANDGAVGIAPPVFMFSLWVEETAVRLRQLRCMDVPGTQSALQALVTWTRARESGPGWWGRAFERSAARQARAADRSLQQWLVEGETPWLEEGFYRQRQRVRRDMEAQRIFTAEDWVDDLARQLDTSQHLPLSLPRQIALRGFVEFTALERKLLESLECRGVALDFGEAAGEAADVRVVEFPRPEDEWQAAALWARDKLAAGARSLCIVVPRAVTTSGTTSRRIRQVLSAVFHPAEAAGLDDEGLRDFHIPAAGRLADSGAIAGALHLLGLSADGLDAELDFPGISQWLLSPHWMASDGEAAARARLEWQLRERGFFRLSPRAVVRLAKADGLDVELRYLVACVQAPPTDFETGRAGDWIHAELLRWGWPGAPAAAAVCRAAEGMQSLIERFNGSPIESAIDAVALLEALCSETTLPFGGGPLSPVQVLPPEVAAGGRFDALWACQMDDANWPPPIDVNPYLPAAARAAIPRLNPNGQLDYYRRLTAKVCAAAPEVCLSWSFDAGEGPRMASGLIADFPAASATNGPPMLLSRAVWPAAGQGGDAALESLSDSHGLAYPDQGVVDLPGGADFFRLQAACPLMAYVRHRLKARFPDMPSALASPQFRGELLHQVLRELYDNALGRQGWPSDADIGPAVDAALARLRARERLTATGLRAEAERLRRLMAEWLTLDRTRSGLEVAGLEQPLEARLGRAALRVRIDRVDRLADGRYFLLDYKSGTAGSSRALKWGRPRIQEPQLPLYALMLEASENRESGGLAFAIVKSGECVFDGISDDPASAATGIRVFGHGRSNVAFTNWASFQDHWRSQLGVLLDEILAGQAENRVYDADALKFGELGLILRHEQAG